MKRLLTILLTFVSLISYSQERVPELEKLIFDKVNQYRVSQGLKPVVWNDKVYEASYHHALYIF